MLCAMPQVRTRLNDRRLLQCGVAAYGRPD
jgi:hypothetical protein